MTLSQQKQLDKTIEFVKNTLADAEGGHDWWHTYRVWKMAVRIAKEENADQFVVHLGALLHDIADSKFTGGDEDTGPEKAEGFLKSIKVNQEVVDHVIQIIRHISFKNNFDGLHFSSLELQVIQDADRLDAIGAIGIARAFSYGGYKKFEIYNPERKPLKYNSKEEYKKSDSPTVNHFYEKLFLLKDMMNTRTGKHLAELRHDYMINYLDQFYEEWEGNR
jgi:uncharacterized protein